MKIIWLIVSLLPASYLFHYYEYGQHILREDATFLAAGSILYILVVGFLSRKIKVHYILLVSFINLGISIFLASQFIADDGGWFKPFGRNVAVLVVAVVFLIGQLITRMAWISWFKKSKV